MAIRREYLVEKRNVLNEIRANGMTLQELRFFSIYLAKINPRDTKTRVVRFNLSDFQRIMEFGKMNLAQIRNCVDSLLCKIVGVPTENGGFVRFQLFKKCKVDIDNGEWYIEIDAHDDALPLMFEFKERYFTYQLWNALRLKSSNQLRMYEILKQYEVIGERIIALDELKVLLGMTAKDYPRYNNFRADVLEVCRQALFDNTDIIFTYEPTGKKGRGGKVLTLKFKIDKNTNHINHLSLEDFINYKECLDNDISPKFNNTYLKFYAEACNMEFDEFEMQVLYDLVIKIIPYEHGYNNQLRYYDYFKRKYDELAFQASRRRINSRFGYIRKIMEVDLD